MRSGSIDMKIALASPCFLLAVACFGLLLLWLIAIISQVGLSGTAIRLSLLRWDGKLCVWALAAAGALFVFAGTSLISRCTSNDSNSDPHTY